MVRLDDCFRSSDALIGTLNEVFGRVFDDGFQRLVARGSAPSPPDGVALELLVVDETGPDRRRTRARGDRPRRAPRRAARAGPPAVGDGRAAAREHRRRPVRGRAPAGGLRDAPHDRRRLLRPPAGLRPVRLPAAPAQPLRRSRAAHGARLAAHRRLEPRALRASPRGADRALPRARVRTPRTASARTTRDS